MLSVLQIPTNKVYELRLISFAAVVLSDIHGMLLFIMKRNARYTKSTE